MMKPRTHEVATIPPKKSVKWKPCVFFLQKDLHREWHGKWMPKQVGAIIQGTSTLCVPTFNNNYGLTHQTISESFPLKEASTSYYVYSPVQTKMACNTMNPSSTVCTRR